MATVRTTTVELANTTTTVTTGATFDMATGAWHENYLSLYASVGTSTFSVEFSADGSNWVPGTDIHGTALTDLTASAFYALPGKVRHMRCNVTAISAGTTLVQVQKAE